MGDIAKRIVERKLTIKKDVLHMCGDERYRDDIVTGVLLCSPHVWG